MQIIFRRRKNRDVINELSLHNKSDCERQCHLTVTISKRQNHLFSIDGAEFHSESFGKDDQVEMSVDV